MSYATKAKLYRVDYIHYVKDTANAKPTASARPSKTAVGYKLTGYKWLWQESFAFNLDNLPSPLEADTVAEVITNSAKTWDDKTSFALFSYTSATTDEPYQVYDETNTIAFGDLGNTGIIAQTTWWYSRAGKAILEFDMCFNTQFKWSASGESVADAMDIQNIATHEFGHAVGLADIYNSNYDYVTMYGYSSYGDIEKISLDGWDIAGLQKIYGE